MIRFMLPAAASIAAGLLLGAAAVLGVTLVAQGDPEPFNQGYEQSTGPNQVQYGDRCIHGHCFSFSCGSTQDCVNKRP